MPFLLNPMLDPRPRTGCRPRFLILLLAAIFSFSGCQLAEAEESAGTNGASLDNLWADEAGAGGGGASVSTFAPMCNLETFQNSPLVQKGGWPGVGPFKAGASGPYEMTDAGQNRLKLRVAADKVTEAEINLVKEKPTSRDFLDIEMTADFLLESVGAKAKRIKDVNTQMAQDKDAVLFKSEPRPLSWTAGRYLLSILRQGMDKADRFNYRIRVNSRDISKDALKEHSVAQGGESGAGSAPLPGGSTTGDGASGSASSTDGQIASASAGQAGTTSDALKDEFASLIRNWQRIKKMAVRQRQTGELPQVLSGRALIRQTDAVKWLLTNHRYYEMNLRGLTVDRYQEASPGSKYTVFAEVKESSKLYDDSSGQVLKDSEDTYKVTYTVEKIQDRWFITDSAIVSTSAASQANRPQPGKVNR